MMSAAYSSRDIVEDYLRYKLLNSGVAWRVRPARTGGWRPRREQGAPTSWLSWRSEGARSHQPGEQGDRVVTATATVLSLIMMSSKGYVEESIDTTASTTTTTTTKNKATTTTSHTTSRLLQKS